MSLRAPPGLFADDTF